MRRGSNPASAGNFWRGIEICSIKMQPRVFKKCDRIWTCHNERKSKPLYSMSERRNLNKFDPASTFQETQTHHTGERSQLWIAMLKRHQVCEEIEGMEGKKKFLELCEKKVSLSKFFNK